MHSGSACKGFKHVVHPGYAFSGSMQDEHLGYVCFLFLQVSQSGRRCSGFRHTAHSGYALKGSLHVKHAGYNWSGF